jgi:hypothetical protein
VDNRTETVKTDSSKREGTFLWALKYLSINLQAPIIRQILSNPVILSKTAFVN